MICTKGLKLEVLQSAAGYYIGTLDEGLPYCRCSEYFDNENLINIALENNIFRKRDCVENEFCNKGLGCVKE